MTTAAALEVKDALPAISLVFTVLSFFVRQRLEDFQPERLDSGKRDFFQAALDLALALSAAAIIWITWPLARDAHVFGDFGEADDVLPNLLGAVLVGVALIGVTQFVLAGFRLLPFCRNYPRASLLLVGVVIVCCVAVVSLL